MSLKKDNYSTEQNSWVMPMRDAASKLSILDPHVNWLVEQGKLETRELDGQLLILSDSVVRLKRSWRKS